MNNTSFFRVFLFIFSIVSLASCDNDSNEMGADIVGNDNFELMGDPYKVTAYTRPLGVVQTSNLGIQQLGIYDDPVFGTTTAHAVVQVTLQTENPTFGELPVVDSVALHIPYFNRVVQTTDSTKPDIYALDSIWGPANGKLNLEIYQSGIYLRPDVENGGIQKYYSDQFSTFSEGIIGTKLNNDPRVKQNTEFVFDNTGWMEVPTENPGGTKIKIGPKMKVLLDKTVFQNLLFGAQANGKLVNNNVFTNYFRGLLFKVSRSGSTDPRLAMVNLAGGTITVYYKQRTAASGDGDTNESKTLLMKLTTNSVNLFEYEHSAEYQNVLAATPNTEVGDEKLYIKGGAGSMAVIELFKTPEEIEALKATKGKWLVNDASLRFFVEENTNNLLNSNAPKRIYLYDLNNNKVLVDYTIDQSQSNSNKYNKSMHGGIIDRVSSSLGTMYRIRITNHIKAIIANTAENFKTVRLGLVVTENINTTSNKSLKEPINLNDSNIFGTDKKIEVVPTMSVAHPFGTVLWGTNLPDDDPRKLKLTIYFTKPN